MKAILISLIVIGLLGCSPKEQQSNVSGHWKLHLGHWSGPFSADLNLTEDGGVIAGTYTVGHGDDGQPETFKVSGVRVQKEVELTWTQNIDRNGVNSLDYTLQGTIAGNKTMSGKYEGKFAYSPEIMMIRMRQKTPSQDLAGLWVAEKQ